MTSIFKVGQVWADRNGKRVTIAEINSNGHLRGDNGFHYWQNGRWYLDDTCSGDLVKLVSEAPSMTYADTVMLDGGVTIQTEDVVNAKFPPNTANFPCVTRYHWQEEGLRAFRKLHDKFSKLDVSCQFPSIVANDTGVVVYGIDGLPFINISECLNLTESIERSKSLKKATGYPVYVQKTEHFAAVQVVSYEVQP